MSIELEPETILHPQPTITSNPSQPPILSTPDTHIFEDPTPTAAPSSKPEYTLEQIRDVYEIERTAREVLEGGWRRVALQFPDWMLVDVVRVFEELGREIERLKVAGVIKQKKSAKSEGLETDMGSVKEVVEHIRLYILADTSYNSCCVDEIAAEHVDADVVVHYGRSCLSPTKTLPVIYVFTSHPLDLDAVVAEFEKLYMGEQEKEGKDQKIIIMADITYHNHITPLATRLRERGWNNLLIPEIQHDPDALIPNRKIPDTITPEELQSYKLFHISSPPNALVMILYSRVGEFTVYPTTSSTTTETLTTTKSLLNRRYALLSHISTQPILGILINTLSHSSTTSILSSLTSLLRQHGKKYYTFVVGKVNAAKMANFSEIGGWIVIGCWEGGLFDEGGFWRGTVTPFELDLALKNEGWRVRGGEWKAGLNIETPLLSERTLPLSEGEINSNEQNETNNSTAELETKNETGNQSDDASDSESEPPEYDFRTGRYITSSHARTAAKSSSKSLQTTLHTSHNTNNTNTPSSSSSTTLTRRTKNTEIASINGVLSPGAEYLRSQRTWQGLGSDFANEESDGQNEGEAGTIEEGRSGVARGYVVGDEGGERR